MLPLQCISVNLSLRPFLQNNALLSCDAHSTITIKVFVSALYMMKQMDVVAAHRVKHAGSKLDAKLPSQTKLENKSRAQSFQSCHQTIMGTSMSQEVIVYIRYLCCSIATVN